MVIEASERCAVRPRHPAHLIGLMASSQRRPSRESTQGVPNEKYEITFGARRHHSSCEDDPEQRDRLVRFCAAVME